jgi:8-oxo-dGTP diphosphatase
VADRTAVIPVTLAFVTCADAVLLLRVGPDRDRFAGLWTGVGGHVRVGENIRSAALREIREETGLAASDPELRAVLHETGLLGRAHLLFVFVARVEQPQPLRECREGALAWFSREQLPWDALVPDLRELLPLALRSGPVAFGVQRFSGGDRAIHLELDEG